MDWDAFIAAARAVHTGHRGPWAIRVEREWSPDGERELSRCPYTPVRFTKTYDAGQLICFGKWVETGLVVEVCP